jgi:CubicO group peptidase (beta-lactamase class C family)
MKHLSFFNRTRKKIKYVRSALCILFINIAAILSAQTNEYFIANGKKVNKDKFNKQVNDMIADIGIPGVSLAVIDNNQITFSNSYGIKEAGKIEPVNKGTVFEAASLTKIYLVYVVHKLVDQGLFSLDKPMYQYLDYQPLKHDARYKLITPRMILSHSSGIENWIWNNKEDTLEIVSNPGERFVYSGEGFQYLAKVIEGVLHQPYEKYMDSMVVQPLKLKDTYFKFNANVPANYATGHTNFCKPVEKWKNEIAYPASSLNTTANQYPKLLIAMFNGNNLSAAAVKNVLTPTVSLIKDNPLFSMGLGFFMMYGNQDTILSFSGDNDGFKAELLYSITKKSGIVFFTNSDRGKLITRRLCQLTVDLKVNPMFFEEAQYQQYPSISIDLLKVYKEQKANAMFEEIEKLHKSDKLSARDLNELSDLFMPEDEAISKRILETTIAFYPSSSLAYGFLGDLYFQKKDYDQAYNNLIKAKELHFDRWDIESNLLECKEKMKDAKKTN